MSENATILEIHPDRATTWTMPWPIYDMVSSALKNPLLRIQSKSGRSHAPSVEYVVNLLPEELRKQIDRKDDMKTPTVPTPLGPMLIIEEEPM